MTTHHEDPNGDPAQPSGPQSPGSPPAGPQSPGGPQSPSGPAAPAPYPQGPESPSSPHAPPPAAPAAQPSPGGGPMEPAPPQAVQPAAQGFAVKRGVGRVVGFTLLSFGLYSFYWFFVTREQVTREIGGDDNAGLQTAGLLVPILNIVIIYWLWRDINVARTRVGLEEFSIPVYLVLSLIGLSPIFYCLVVSKLNEYWDRRTGGQAVDAPVTGGEKAVVAVGAAFLILWILGFILIIILAVVFGDSSSTSVVAPLL